MEVLDFIVHCTKNKELLSKLKTCNSIDQFISFAKESGHNFSDINVRSAFAKLAEEKEGDFSLQGYNNGEATRRG